MFLRKILKHKNTLAFRLAILYAGIFTLSSLLIFSLCYIKIYAVSMENLDDELEDEIERYTAMLSYEGLEALTEELIEESEKEDPHEEYFRLLSREGGVLKASPLASWDFLNTGQTLKELQDEEDEPIFQTGTAPGAEDRTQRSPGHVRQEQPDVPPTAELADAHMAE